jgi:SRSO17 transposase
MQLPIVAPAPLVTNHSGAFRDLFNNRRQFRHFENYLTGLTVLPNKSLANIARCILESADKSNLSRFFSEAEWDEAAINQRRVEYLLAQTEKVRGRAKAGRLIVDDTLCEHVGSLFEYVDQHYNHGDNRYPLAHNLVTSHYVNGPVRFPVDLRQYRRYEEITQWERFVHQHLPQRQIPKSKRERAKFHKEVDPTLLLDPEFLALHEQFRTKIALAMELIEKAIERGLPFEVVLFDGWYLAEELIEVLKGYQKDWVSILKKNRKLETNSFVLKDKEGQPIQLAGPHIKVEALVPLIPANAYRSVTIDDKTYWCFSLNLRIPGLGKVRLVLSFDNPKRTGTFVALITNRTDWSAKQILLVYLQRWPIETFYQDGKQHLGLDEYRMRSAQAIQKHWSLVFVAYSFLHLDCLPASPQKGIVFPLKSIGEACRQQAQALIQALILQAHHLLEQDVKVQDVFTRLFAKQGVVSPA